MATCGMLKGFNALFVAMGLYSDVSGGYMVINAEEMHYLHSFLCS